MPDADHGAAPPRIPNHVANRMPPALPTDDGYGKKLDGRLLGDLTVRYLPLPTWPGVRLLSLGCEARLRPFWLAVRHEPRDGITLIHNRCTTCGWWSRRLAAEDPDGCSTCHDSSICRQCTYMSADGTRYCMRCGPHTQRHPYQVYYEALMDIIEEPLDHLHMAGRHYPHRVTFFLRSRACCFRPGTLADVWKAWKESVRRV